MLATIALVAVLLVPPIHDNPADEICSIRSNAGNCYAPGEYCRRADLGNSTTTQAGETITCVMESGRPHWHHS